MRRRRARQALRLIEPARDGVVWWCRPFGAAADAPVAVELVPDGAEPGSTWIADISTFSDGTVVVHRITAPLAEHADEDDDPEGGRSPAGAGRSTRRPVPPRVRAERLARGTIVSAHIEFSGTPGVRDGNLLGKYRPCVVIADHGASLDVQPLYTSGGAAGRGGHPVADWHAAGLTKPTVLGPETRRIDPDDVGSPIGMLTPRDLPNLNPPRRL